MSHQDEHSRQLDLDTQVLSDFIYELNISRRHLSTYPAGHPMIATSVDKVLVLLDRLFEFREVLAFGVARDTLMFEQDWLDKKNPVFRDFAGFLFGQGIAAISFQRRPSRDEFIRLNQLLRADRQTIAEHGGYPDLLQQQQVSHIEITPVDYRAFHTTEEAQLSQDDRDGSGKRESLWEDFLLGLMDGTLDPDGESFALPQEFDPNLVAGILNRKFEGTGMSGKENYDKVITSFISQMNQPQRADRGRREISSQLGALIGQLSPELRRQFLNSTFRSLDAQQESAEEVLENFPSDVILSSLQDFNENRLKISSTMVNLLGKLTQHQQSDQPKSVIGRSLTPSQHNIEERMRIIFREEETGKFIPDSYQQALDTIVSTDQHTLLPQEEQKLLQTTLKNQSVERQTSAIIFELMRSGVDPELEDILQRNLVDLGHFFLEIGDFTSLCELHQRWLDYLNSEHVTTLFLAEEVLSSLSSPEFIEETLAGLERWDKEKHEEIGQYIKAIGAPFAETLIERLAAEERMTMRRFYMETLTALGPQSHEAIFAVLEDERWYLVRNLLVVLRRQNDPTVLKRIYPLIDHPHPRVHQEVLKVLFKYNRPRADRLLLKELASEDREQQLFAVQLADRSQDPAILFKLLDLLRSGGLNEEALAFKSQIVRTLGKLGNPDALPVLRKLLGGTNLLHPRCNHQLKLEIVRSLGSYPLDSVKVLLEKQADSGNRELAHLAAEQLRHRQGRNP